MFEVRATSPIIELFQNYKFFSIIAMYGIPACNSQSTMEFNYCKWNIILFGFGTICTQRNALILSPLAKDSKST